jgi:hypothetical protein
MRTADPRRTALLLGAGFGFGLCFVLVALFERSGLGLGRFLFLPVVLFALATDAWLGALGGVLATGLYVLGVLVSPRIPQSSIVTFSMLVRFVSFVAVGALIGYFAKEHRELVGRLWALAERDELTGLPRGRAFESEMSKRLGESGPSRSCSVRSARSSTSTAVTRRMPSFASRACSRRVSTRAMPSCASATTSSAS